MQQNQGSKNTQKSTSKEPKTFSVFRIKWRKTVIRDLRMSAMDVRIALLIEDMVNVARGYAWPGQAHLGKLAGVNERTVRRSVTRLKEAGYFAVQPHRLGGRTSKYEMTIPSDVSKPSGHSRSNDRTQLSGDSGHQSPLHKNKYKKEQIIEPEPFARSNGGEEVSTIKTRWPDDVEVPIDWRTVARAKRREKGLVPVDIDREAELFVNQFVAEPNPSGMKADWLPVWIRWVVDSPRAIRHSGIGDVSLEASEVLKGTGP
jgi:hypothetical protein